ncbi:MAG: metal-dependent hydrolase [Spirochaetes bacterium]|nr:metal-dependent hydrolase [Spirochaetota bacterium]
MSILSVFDEKNPTAPKKVTPPKVRSPKWDFSDFHFDLPNPDATENNVFRRAYLIGLSMLFPEGERFFIRAVKRYADAIQDPQLKKDVKAFIAQEAQHGRQHEILNETFGQKYDVDSFLKNWTGFAFGFLEKLSEKYIPLGGGKLELAITAAAEHFTATWGAAALKSPSFAAFESQSIKDLIYWHAIEEIEHKHVAFDVMREVSPNYFLRTGAMLITGVLIGGLSAWGFSHIFLEEIKNHLKEGKPLDIAQVIRSIGYESFDKDGMFRQFAVAFVTYFRPNFHPSDMDDQALFEEFASLVDERTQKVA